MPDQPGENEDRADSNETSLCTICEAVQNDYGGMSRSSVIIL